jgi:hypothetical protein
VGAKIDAPTQFKKKSMLLQGNDYIYIYIYRERERERGNRERGREKLLQAKKLWQRSCILPLRAKSA